MCGSSLLESFLGMLLWSLASNKLQTKRAYVVNIIDNVAPHA